MGSAMPDRDTADVRLRDVVSSDLPIFFGQQLDPAVNWQAAFTARDPTDHAAFMAHWARIMADAAEATVTIQTILYDDQVAGYIGCYVEASFGKPEVTYWLGANFSGKGVATRALATFLDSFPARPIYAHVAKDHHASLRVLEKCGFAQIGEGKGYAEARGTEVEECILELR
jgi:RimJ/RimL family protein N-acetyltransferase